MLRRCAFPAWHFLWFWICSLIRSWLVCVVSILIPCIPGLISICFRIQKSSILRASQISSKNKKVPKNQHFFTHHPYFLDINTTHSTWLDCSRLMSDFSSGSREFIKACFFRKTHRFLPLCVLGNRSKALLLPIICKRTDLPTASRLRSEGTSLKSHRLNSNLPFPNVQNGSAARFKKVSSSDTDTVCKSKKGFA